MENCIIFSLPKSNAFFRFVIGEGDSFFDFISFENQASPVSFKGTVQEVDLQDLQINWRANKTDAISTNFNDYEKAFFQIQNQIRLGVVSKVILSKLTVKEVNLDFIQIKNILSKLRDKNPNAFIYFLSTENSGTWIGASPELLIKKQNQTAQTIALAGTKFLINDNWTNKEFEEQKIVADYIIGILKKYKLDFIQSNLETLQSGAIYHLANSFEIENFSNEILQNFLQDFHPTPAISGFPKQNSIELIKLVEKHLRRYYCGYLGVGINQEIHYFINLRCAEIFNNKIVAYSGGGITADSVCEKEWLECNKKSEAILSAL
jgi:isochorismate synthase